MAARPNHRGDAAALAAVLASLRALYVLHQTHHWQSGGPGFYSDHLMFERLYQAILPEIDSAAERAVGSGEASLVSAVDVTRATEVLLSRWQPQGHHPDALVAASLSAERDFLSLLEQTLREVPFSQGAQNMLQGFADTHEGHAYLLGQRLGG